MLVVQRFLTQQASHPSRPWKMRFIIWSISFLIAIKRIISQQATELSLKEPIQSLVLSISPRRYEDDVLEIGYTLHPDYWGRGYVPEAARALIDLAFKELNLHKIELSCFGYNLQSQRVAEKLGFTLEARIRDRKDTQGNRCDSLVYGLLRSEWKETVR